MILYNDIKFYKLPPMMNKTLFWEKHHRKRILICEAKNTGVNYFLEPQKQSPKVVETFPPSTWHIFYYSPIHLSPQSVQFKRTSQFRLIPPKDLAANCSLSNFPCREILSRTALGHNRPSSNRGRWGFNFIELRLQIIEKKRHVSYRRKRKSDST